MSSDFWVVTCYFNPARYKTKRRNFDAFMAGMRTAGANVLVVELAFGDDPFELEPGAHVVQLRGSDILWQKERLLNLAASRLPGTCRKVGWFDADVIFKEPDWLERTSDALERFMVVQPFSHAVRLNRDNRDDGTGVWDESFAALYVRDRRLARTAPYRLHGHTGYAWAARRELFDQCGLYDACLTGSSDHLMAHVFAAGMVNSPCMPATLGGSPRYVDHFLRWAIKTRDFVGANLGVVPGRILHLWHGDIADRRYSELDRQLRKLDYDPDLHLAADESGLWKWSAATPAQIKDWSNALFANRNEDGDRASAAPAANERRTRADAVRQRA